MAMDPTDLDEVLAKARELATTSGDSPLDSYTIKDLRLAVDPESDKVLTNDQAASIISVIILAT